MSIYKIAELAKVSPATVSKVINNRDGISDEVRARVMAVIEEQNFTPKTALNVSNNIALVAQGSDPNRGIFYSDYMIGVMRGVSEYAFNNGYNLTMYPLAAIPKSKKEFTVFCHQQRLTGMIFTNPRNDDRFIEEIAGVVPMVTINTAFTGDKLYSVCSDDFNGMYSAVKYLYEMGHRRIAISAVGLCYDANRDKLEAYKQAAADFRLPVDDEFIFENEEIAPTSICNRFERLRRGGKMPTALLTMNDELAIRLINILHLIDVLCPRDISVVGYDDYDYAAYIHPALTTVKQVLFDKGKLAAQLATGAAVSMPRGEDGRYVFRTQIILRDSVARIRPEDGGR